MTTGDTWGTNDIPFYVYAVGNDAGNAIAFMISRNPGKTTSPALAKIGAPDDAVADSQSSFWSLENIDETLYDENTCILIGSFRMRFTQPGGADDWTVQALGGQDGVGLFQEGKTFTFPTGVNGAASGTHLQANGGTAPVFTTNNYDYHIDRGGMVTHQVFLDADGGTDGAGAVSSLLSTPFIPQFVNVNGVLRVKAPTTSILTEANANLDQTYISLTQCTDGTNITNAEFTNGTRQITGIFNMRIKDT